MDKLKREIIETYNLRPSTADKVMEILDLVSTIATTEYQRGLQGRAKGEWLESRDPSMWTCSNCGYRVMRYNNTNYCPNCGAEMWNDM